MRRKNKKTTRQSIESMIVNGLKYKRKRDQFETKNLGHFKKIYGDLKPYSTNQTEDMSTKKSTGKLSYPLQTKVYDSWYQAANNEWDLQNTQYANNRVKEENLQEMVSTKDLIEYCKGNIKKKDYGYRESNAKPLKNKYKLTPNCELNRMPAAETTEPTTMTAIKTKQIEIPDQNNAYMTTSERIDKGDSLSPNGSQTKIIGNFKKRVKQPGSTTGNSRINKIYKTGKVVGHTLSNKNLFNESGLPKIQKRAKSNLKVNYESSSSNKPKSTVKTKSKLCLEQINDKFR